nr:hypothetical protein [Rhodopirellula sp. SM50]
MIIVKSVCGGEVVRAGRIASQAVAGQQQIGSKEAPNVTNVFLKIVLALAERGWRLIVQNLDCVEDDGGISATVQQCDELASVARQ